MKKTSPAIEMTLSAGRPAAYDTTGFDTACGESDRIALKDREIASLHEEIECMRVEIELSRSGARVAARGRDEAIDGARALRERDIACAVNRVHLRHFRDLAEVEAAMDTAYASGVWGFTRGRGSSRIRSGDDHPLPLAMAGLFRAITRAGNAGVMRHRTEYARHRASAARRLDRAGAMRRAGWSSRFVSPMICMARVHRLCAEYWALYVRVGGSEEVREGLVDPGWDQGRCPALRLTMLELEVEFVGLQQWAKSFVDEGRMGEWRWWVDAESGVLTRPREIATHRAVMGGSEAPGKIPGNFGGYSEERGYLNVGGYTGPIAADTTGSEVSP